MALKAGTLEKYEGSMAADIENAFITQWPSAMGNQPAPTPNSQMRLLFIAMAQGVIRHLQNNADAFDVTVYDTLENLLSANITIEADPKYF